MALPALAPPSPTSAEAVGVPRLAFHSQVAHRAELLPAGVCGLCPPAPSGWQKPLGEGRITFLVPENLLAVWMPQPFKEELIPSQKCETGVSQINHGKALWESAQTRGPRSAWPASKGLMSRLLSASLLPRCLLLPLEDSWNIPHSPRSSCSRTPLSPGSAPSSLQVPSPPP